MKKSSFFLFMFLIIGLFSKTNSNPIAPTYYITEFSIDTLGWQMEINFNLAREDSVSLNGWYITTQTDTSYFKDGVYFNSEGYVIITNDNLLNELKINLYGDVIRLINPNNFAEDSLIFGECIQNSGILSPKQGQSICKGFISIPYGSMAFLYFDNTPTFGFPNDTLNATGFVDGFIKDISGNPLSNVTVLYSYIKEYYGLVIDSAYVKSDSKGYFKFNNYAKITSIHFMKENYIDSSVTIQVLPDSTITLQDLNLIAGIAEKVPSNIINDFYLSQNYPNPFNNSTSFFYTLPKSEYVEVTIYDEKGALVGKLFSGNQSEGKYKINWNTGKFASGVYIYQVRTNSFSLSKKAILLK